MKTITVTELKSILASHKLWIESSCKQGECANLTDADLTDADLTGTNLEKKEEKNKNVCVNSSFGEELQMLLDKHGVKLAAAIQLELK